MVRWFRRRPVPPDPRIRTAVEDEVTFHFEERVREGMRAGLSRTEAEARAHLEFGDAGAVRIELETIDLRIDARRRRASVVDALRLDLRYVIRSLTSAPGFTVLVVVLLAVGMGANGALFTVVDRIFFREPSGVGHPPTISRLYRTVSANNPLGDGRLGKYLHYPGIKSITGGLPPGTFAGYMDRLLPLGHAEDAPQVRTAWVTSQYFSLLQVPSPALGRYLSDDECRVPSTAKVAVISHAEWQRRHGGRPDILGTAVEFQGHPFTIVGVAAPAFGGIDVDVVAYWMPLGAFPYPFKEPWYELRYDQSIRMIARSSQPRDQLAAAATAAFQAGEPPRQAPKPIVAGPLVEARGPMKATTEEAIAVRLSLVALVVLVIACANAGGLILARSLARRREIAVRLALGMSRGRTASLFVVESLVLSLAAGVLSVALAAVGGMAMRQTLLPDVVWAGTIVDGRLALFALALSFVVALVACVPAVIGGAREGLAPVLKMAGRGGGERSPRLRNALLVVQVALSVVLLAGATAFIRSLYTATSIDTGYDVERLLTLSVRKNVGILPAAEQAAALHQLVTTLGAHPAVESVALSGSSPLAGSITPKLFRQDGSALPGAGDLSPSYMTVTGTYFRTAGIPLVDGRGFGRDDRPGGAPVVVVNQTMADAIWPGRTAVGQCLRMGTPDAPCRSVIGVVANTHRDGLVEKPQGRAPLYFVPQGQATGEFAAPYAMLIRTAAGFDVDEAAEIVRRDVRGVLPPNVIARVAPLAASFERQLRPWRLGSQLFSAFGLLALLVAAAGVYSSNAFSVARRTREMGIRMALGAAGSRVVALVMRESLALVLAGVGVGVVAAIGSARLVESLLYQTSAADPIVLAAASTVMLIVALAGCAIPALRAARVDPTITLRND
jgi:putative ABC transport system permease protein